MDKQFVYPWVLMLLWLVPAVGGVWVYAWRRRQQAMDAFLSAPMMAKLCPAQVPVRFYWQLALCLVGLLAGVIALARPQWGTREETVIMKGRDLVIALDVSRSMLARDVHPSRLMRAKTDIQDLLRELKGDRASLVVFRGKAVPLCPLTTDYAFFEQMLNDVGVDSAPRGETDIGDAIRKALSAFESDAGSHKAIIIISDGEDLAGQAKAAAEEAKKKGVVIFTVGLGNPQGSKIPLDSTAGYVAFQGQEVVSKLEHDTLKALAELTGGVYVPVGTANVRLGTLYREHLSRLAEQEQEESVHRTFIERYQYILLVAVLALLGAALLSQGRLARAKRRASASGVERDPGSPLSRPMPVSTPPPLMRPKARTGLLALSLACALAPALWAGAPAGAPALSPSSLASALPKPGSISNALAPAQAASPETMAPPAMTNIPPGRAGARVAQSLYVRGRYREAAEAYRQAMQGGSLKSQNDFLYNAACSLYRDGQYQAAADTFVELSRREAADGAAAWYNAGCALWQQAEQSVGTGSNRTCQKKPEYLEKAGASFLRALRAQPDSDARANVAVVANALPAAREQAKMESLLSRYGQMQPFQMAEEALMRQREIAQGLSTALTNTAPSRISQFESLAELQKNNRDVLMPLRSSLMSALKGSGLAATSTAQQAESVNRYLDAAGTVMGESVEALRNLDPRAFHPVMKAESDLYQFWKGLAAFPAVLKEDLRRQTNAIEQTGATAANIVAQPPEGLRYQQQECMDLTRLFAERFQQAVPPGGLPAQAQAQAQGQSAQNPASTHEAPAITAETRAQILKLTEEACGIQSNAVQQLGAAQYAEALMSERKSHDLLKAIEALLPKDKNQPQSQDQNQQDSSKDNQKQDKNQQDKNQQNQDQQKQESPQKQDNQDQPEAQEPKPEPTPAQPEQGVQGEKDQKASDKEMSKEQARALLEKAMQREKDHREQRERDPYIPPSPVERDW